MGAQGLWIPFVLHHCARHSAMTTMTTLAITPLTSMNDHPLNLSALVHNGRELCKDILDVVELLLANTEFIQAIRDLTGTERRTFKNQSYCGAVWIGRRYKDLGNICYCVLFQLLWYVAKSPNHAAQLELLQELSDCWPSLGDKWDPSSDSIEMKADVIEYVLAVARLTGDAVSNSQRVPRSECNQLIRRWYGQWERVLKIIAIDEHERNSDVIRHIQTPRNLAQLIGLGAVATRMERSGDDAALQRALQHYAH